MAVERLHVADEGGKDSKSASVLLSPSSCRWSASGVVSLSAEGGDGEGGDDDVCEGEDEDVDEDNILVGWWDIVYCVMLDF